MLKAAFYSISAWVGAFARRSRNLRVRCATCTSVPSAYVMLSLKLKRHNITSNPTKLVTWWLSFISLPNFLMKMDVINDSVNHIIHQFSSPVFVSPAFLQRCHFAILSMPPLRWCRPALQPWCGPQLWWRSPAGPGSTGRPAANSRSCAPASPRNAGRNRRIPMISYDHFRTLLFFFGECLRKSCKIVHLQKPELRVKCQTTCAPLHPMHQLQWGRGAHPACLRKRRHPCQILPLTSAPRRHHSILPMFISWHSDKVWYSDDLMNMFGSSGIGGPSFLMLYLMVFSLNWP